MRGNYYNSSIKREVAKSRSKGTTYRELKIKFGIPKSTLSTWLSKTHSKIFSREKQLKHLARTRPLALEAKRKIKEEKRRLLIERVRADVATHPLANAGFFTHMTLLLQPLQTLRGISLA